MNIDDVKSSEPPRLKDHQVLSPFMEYLKPTCINIEPGDHLVVYRTQDQIPVDEYGESPRPRRKFKDAAIRQTLTPEEVRELSPRKRERMMGEWGLSCNDSEESARSNFLFTYESLKRKGATKLDLEAFATERGIHICRYKVTSETGLITPFDDHGHANLYLYEGVNLEDIRDKEYNYKTIDYQTDEE